MSEESGGGSGHDFVRPFIMTGGRTARRHLDLRLETLVRAMPTKFANGAMPSEKAAVLELAVDPISVAEIAAELNLVVGVVTVLIEDLVDSGYAEVFLSEPDDVELDMLTRITDKIRSL